MPKAGQTERQQWQALIRRYGEDEALRVWMVRERRRKMVAACRALDEVVAEFSDPGDPSG